MPRVGSATPAARWRSPPRPAATPGPPRGFARRTTMASRAGCGATPDVRRRRTDIMCGVIGVSGVPDAARVAYLGLYALQHRGQESAGIVTLGPEGQPRIARGMGLV